MNQHLKKLKRSLVTSKFNYAIIVSMKIRRLFRIYSLIFLAIVLLDAITHIFSSQPISFWAFLTFLMLVWIGVEFRNLGEKSDHPFDSFFESKQFSIGFAIICLLIVVITLF